MAGTALVLALLCGCGAGAPAPAAAPATGAPVGPADATRVATATELPESRPVRLRIPAIGVDTTTMDLGLHSDGTLEVPPDGTSAGWYTGSPTPGELGPSVLAAHVDWKGERGVFSDLGQVESGDEVTVYREDGRVARFSVVRVEQYSKDGFPTGDVYGDVGSPQLRLITCGGDFDDEARSYRDNVVVYAELTGSA
jgi:sortase (surface protein transpeptidase)